eukprot:Nitzschia sp. Nitz4//scaffold36_size144017//74960//75637//NITZ4_003096-RA/size144017-exonerate_protein2genome-gene-0.33-mRNA-1//1//CDS//3329549486//4745//frame0
MSILVQSLTSSTLFRVGSLLALIIAFQVVLPRAFASKLSPQTQRRCQHAITGHALVQVSYLISRRWACVLLFLASAAIYILQVYHSPLFRKLFGGLLRPHEMRPGVLPGAFWFLVGSGLTVWFTDDWTIARYAVECLAWADPVASWVGGSLFPSSPRITPHSSVAGCLGCFGTAIGVGYLWLGTSKWETILGGALMCTIAESFPYVDDNLTIPLSTALVVQALGS